MSKFLSIGTRDLIRGAVVATISTVLTGVATSMQSGKIDLVQIKTSALVGVAAGISYLVKNFITNSTGEILKPEEKK